MKKLLLLFAIGLYGCSQAPKNVVAQDGKNALQTSCPSGFNVIEKEQYTIDLDLPVRALTFRCN